MKKCVVFLVSLFIAAAASAQLPRTFVSSTGTDANPCSRTLPCRNFTAALAATTTGGEVIALDSAGYGPATITTSMSIISPAGVYAGITASTGPAISVNAPSATVILRGLSLNSLGTNRGVEATHVGSLYVESCVISRFPLSAVYFASAGNLFVNDTTVRGGGAGIGVYLSPGASGIQMNATVDGCRFEDVYEGLEAGGSGSPASTVVTVRNSVFSAGTNGINLNLGADITVLGSLFTGFQSGIYQPSLGAGSIAIANSAFTYCGNGIAASAASFGNNQFRGNQTDGTNMLSAVAQH